MTMFLNTAYRPGLWSGPQVLTLIDNDQLPLMDKLRYLLDHATLLNYIEFHSVAMLFLTVAQSVFYISQVVLHQVGILFQKQFPYPFVFFFLYLIYYPPPI